MALKPVVAVAFLGVIYTVGRLCLRSRTSMTNKLKQHVIRCEKAMQSAKPLLGGHGFPDDHRTVTTIGFISMLVEHQESVLLLVMQEKVGSAAALVRPVVEGAYRALWINLPATDEEVKKFNERDKIDLEFGEIAAALAVC